MDGRQQSVRQQRLHDVAGWKNNVPAGISAHYARQHFFVAFVDAIAGPDAELGFEFRDCIGRDTGRPVKYVEARAAVARACGKAASGETGSNRRGFDVPDVYGLKEK
jgi:hypothetical protein